MTPRRAELLLYIIECYERHGYPPTLRELMLHFGWRSTNAPTELLAKLQRDGFIELHKGEHKVSPRGIKVLRQPDGRPYLPPEPSDEERCRSLRSLLPAQLVGQGGLELHAMPWGEPVRNMVVALDAPRVEAIMQLQRLLAGG